MLLDLPSRQDFESLQQKLDAVLGLLSRAPQPVDVALMSVLEVAAYTRFDRRTVEKWVEEGQFNQEGRKIYLPAHQYGDRLRFKRADVDAFGLGIGALQPSREGIPQAVKTNKKSASMTSEKALKVA